MPLRTYTKQTNYSSFKPKEEAEFSQQFVAEIPPDQVEVNKMTVWKLFASFYYFLKKIVATSTIAGLIIPAAFIAMGIGLVYLQFQPTIVEQVKDYAGYYDQGTTTPVQEDYIVDRLQYVSNPGADYFQTITAAINNVNIGPDTFSLNYKGTMYLTVPALKFNRLPITANVESNSKDIYDKVLTRSLAHFKGTGTPASDVDSNIVIYGHSAGGSYNPSPRDVLAAFSFLGEMKVGNEIKLEMDGRIYKYKMTRSKIVAPEDVSVITGTPGKETLTLFTCWPPGNNSSRLVVTAIPVD